MLRITISCSLWRAGIESGLEVGLVGVGGGLSFFARLERYVAPCIVRTIRGPFPMPPKPLGSAVGSPRAETGAFFFAAAFLTPELRVSECAHSGL
jgi:hypothetical protein